MGADLRMRELLRRLLTIPTITRSASINMTEPSSKEDKELGLSDLDDYDPLESESSEGELKAPSFVPGGEGEPCKEPSLVEGSTLERAKSCLKDPQEGCEAAAELLGARQRSCEAQHHHRQPLLEGNSISSSSSSSISKPRIWSLAHTATSLNQAEFPSCMLKRQQGAPSGVSLPAPPSGPALERPPKDSPVANLRNWVDGVFHDPLFRHSTLNQALGSTAVSWAASGKGSPSLLEAGALGRSLGGAAVLKGQLAQDSGKDFLASSFPKAGSKMFCS
ncbi:hypothetical protein JD844_016965 [Phrynosoma platyrhinos]|uniref:Iroquois-class homeodomain protein domain-containing protein n=1 Tax=Phrynosoma platyrhinos TaxID=52577 RepID=A0ABQ7SL38_PHRPL|nr:hypothetical protein JD844_016965 [Phrynosoma platyrhinos]